MKNSIRFLMVFAALTMASSVPSYADEPTTTTGTTNPTVPSDTTMLPQGNDQVFTEGACAQDVKQFCSDVTPGHGRIFACLKAHDDKISQSCLKQTQAVITEFREIHKACKADMHKFCKNAHVGGGNMMSCLKEHMDQLSTPCKTEMDTVK